MNRSKGIIVLISVFLLAVVAIIIFIFASSRSNQKETGSTVLSQNNIASLDSGVNNATEFTGYQKYSKDKLSANKTVILFFKASWCPSCSALDRDIKNNLSLIPNNVLILEVAYDKSSGATDEELELGKRNGVNYQHTLMVVDSQGSKTRALVSAFKLTQVLDDLNR